MPKQSKPLLMAARHPKSPMAEAYRMLRTNLQFATAGHSIRTIMVTSAGAGEGKSTTVANLGVVLAQGGSKVLIVDCDLRRPVMHKVFELANGRGLTNAIVEDVDPLTLVLPTSTEGLSVLPSGPLPPNPAELLGTQRFKTVLGRLKEHYDLVCLDTTPALAVADAAVLATAVDAAILVARRGVTRTDMLLEAKEVLAPTGVRLLGVILNGVRMDGDGYYYYYHHYYTKEETSPGHD